MRILLLGGSGLLGRTLKSILTSYGHDCIATFYKNPTHDSEIFLNIHDPLQLQQLLEKTNPDLCINCIVERFTDICEKNWDRTKSVNIDAVSTILDACNTYHIPLLHISTDYVFDGSTPPYSPDSQTNPLQNYGISKLIAEQRILASSKSYVIVRVPVLYSDHLKNLEDSAVTVIGKAVMNQIELSKEEHISIRRPVFIADLCHFLHHIATHLPEFLGKIHHFYNPHNSCYTKYQIAQLIAEYLHKDISHITPAITYTSNAKRPYDTNLIDTSYDRNQFPYTSLKEGITRCFSKYQHPPLDQCNSNDVFILLDLDGTLVNTEQLHYDSYMNAFKEMGISTPLSFEEFVAILNNTKTTVKDELSKYAPWDELSYRKKMCLLNSSTPITWMPGMYHLVQWIIDNNIGHAVVTNTSHDVVRFFKQQLPLLNNLTNWIAREDYRKAKPDPECFTLAMERFYKNQPYVIGFENTVKGYLSLKEVTSRIYIITTKNHPSYDYFKKEDVYLIQEYRPHV